MLTVSILAALAVPNRAAANPFAATTVSPSTQSVAVGTPCSVDIVFAVPAGGYTAYGIDALVGFDPTKVQVTSVTGNPAHWANPGDNPNFIDNTNGRFRYAAKGANVSGATIAVATVVFTPIAAGTSPINFLNVNEDIVGYGPYGVNGLAVGGTITITAPPATSVFASGISAVTAWDPIFPSSPYSDWTSQCTAVPLVGPDANWQNPHPATAFPRGTHPWENIYPYNFDASWINAWSYIQSRGAAGQSWTKYSTTVTGQGDFVVQFLADNCSWIYLDGQLIGHQDENWSTNGTGRYPVTLTGAGPHELVFIIWDGGGAAGGKFRLETQQSFIANGGDIGSLTPPADTTPPVVTPPSNVIAEATGPTGAIVSFPNATAVDNVGVTSGPVSSPASNSLFPLGVTTVTCVASDAAGNLGGATFTVTVRDTTPPALTGVPANITTEATSANGAVVNFAAATATDVVDGAVAVTAFPASGSTFPIGTHTVTLTATDAHHNTSTRSFTVTVRDTTAPVISSLTPSQATLWPPNHQMVPVSLRAVATDTVGVASLKITGVTSSEPDNGLGDGDMPNDIEITGSLTVNLRAERSGGGSGRTYTIRVEAKDAAGNASTKTCTVSVAKSQGGR